MTPLEALYRCQRAWERTQPQLFWTDEVLFDGLDEREACRPPLVEPAVSPPIPPGGGLTVGAEPCRDLLGTDGESALFTAPAAAWSAGSAPLSTTTPRAAYPWTDERGTGQRR